MADTSGETGGAYEEQHLEAARLVAESVAHRTGIDVPWSLVYQSRSGAPHVPWLEPDINDALKTLADKGCSTAVVVPIGFVSDHMEVLWDLDTQAQRTATELGMQLVRVPTPGTDPRTVSMVVDLFLEREQAIPHVERLRLGVSPASPDRCAAGCCPNPHGQRPAVAGTESNDSEDEPS
jgi:ferrochelatase